MRRVVVTGMALASPLGCDINTAFSGLQKLENCIEYDTKLDQYKRLNTRLSAYVRGFEIPSTYNRKVLRTMGPVSIMAVRTAELALEDAGLLGDEIITNGDTGVSYGSSAGSLDAIIDFPLGIWHCAESRCKDLSAVRGQCVPDFKGKPV